jgi:SnoaL-like protein
VNLPMSLGVAFLEALDRHDPSAALALIDPEAPFEIVPASIKGAAGREGRRFVESLLRALPNLSIRRHGVVDAPELAVARVTMEGTQAAELFGVLNQEKYLDLEQAWMFWATGTTISRVRAYWCQNQLYRRLAVRRLDRVSILG